MINVPKTTSSRAGFCHGMCTENCVQKNGQHCLISSKYWKFSHKWIVTLRQIYAIQLSTKQHITAKKQILSVLTAIFQVNLGQPVFIEAKDDDNWSYTSCKAPVKSKKQITQIYFVQSNHLTHIVSEMTYNVLTGTLTPTHSLYRAHQKRSLIISCE